MVQTIRYIDTYGHTFNDVLSGVSRLGDQGGWSIAANNLQSLQSTIIFDDPNNTVGHGGDAIRGLKQIAVDESDETSGNQRLWFGFIRDRTYSRGDSVRPSLRTGTQRQIEVSLEDCNAIANFRIFTPSTANALGTGKRPAESVGTRIEWLLRTQEFGTIVRDEGFVDYPSTHMDAADYGLQRPGDVLADCALAASVNTFIYWDEAHSVFALWFRNSNTSTSYSSTLKLSGVLSDCDFTTTFPATDARLGRSPDRVYAGVGLPYSTGTYYGTRAATADNYGWRDGIAPNSNVSSLARATSDVGQFLTLSSTEEDRAYVDVELPSNLVNHIRPGMRVQCKWPWFPADTVSGLDYSDFRWFRVMSWTVMNIIPNQLMYTVRLELSPQLSGAPANTCATSVLAATNTATLDLYPIGSGTPVSLAASAAPFANAMQVYWMAYVGPSMGLGGCAPLVVGGGWTLLDQESSLGASIWVALGYLSQPTIASPPNMTVSAMCTGGGPAEVPAIAYAFPSSSTSPVQKSPFTGSGNATMPGTPTPGNILYCASIGNVGGQDTGPWIADGGTILYGSTFYPGTGVYVTIGIRCVRAGETTTIRVPSGPSANVNIVSEWLP